MKKEKRIEEDATRPYTDVKKSRAKAKKGSTMACRNTKMEAESWIQ